MVNVALLMCTLVNSVIIYEAFDRRLEITLSLYSYSRYENDYLYNFGTMKRKYTFPK